MNERVFHDIFKMFKRAIRDRERGIIGFTITFIFFYLETTFRVIKVE